MQAQHFLNGLLLGLGSISAWVVIFGCLACQMALGLAYMRGVVLKDIVSTFEWSRTAYSGSSIPMLLMMGLAAPLVGWLTDRYGPKGVISGGIVLSGACMWLFGEMQSLWHFYAIYLLFGLALTGVGDIPVGAVAARWFSTNRATALAVVYIGSNIGGVIVAMAATGLKEVYD